MMSLMVLMISCVIALTSSFISKLHTLPVERVECYDFPDGLDDLLCHCLDLIFHLKATHGILPVERVECYNVPDGLDDLLCHCLDLLCRLKVVMFHILCERHQHWLFHWAFFVLATPKKFNQRQS